MPSVIYRIFERRLRTFLSGYYPAETFLVAISVPTLPLIHIGSFPAALAVAKMKIGFSHLSVCLRYHKYRGFASGMVHCYCLE